MLEQAEFVNDYSPFQPHLSLAEIAKRTQQLVDVVSQRLQACAQQTGADLKAMPPQNELQSDALQIREVKPTLGYRSLRRNPDVLDVAYDLLSKVEADTANICGPPSGDDQALLLILAQRENQ